jgi:glycine/D-amino acid oxidase-like deaminating enzyme
MGRLYNKEIYNFDEPVKSFWEEISPPDQTNFSKLEGDHECEVAVIGGGFTGISTAYHLAKNFNSDVRLLEAGHMGWASSGRNAGFACLPATKLSIKQLFKRYGEEEAKLFFKSQVEGIDLLQSIMNEHQIECEQAGSGNYDVAHHPDSTEDLKNWGADLQNHFGIKTKWIPKEEFDQIGHKSTEQFGAIHMDAGFAMNPMKFLSGFANAANEAGAKLHAHSNVIKWEKSEGMHKLITRDGSLRAKKVVMATNGYTDESLNKNFAKRILPVLSNIIVTREMTEDEFNFQNYKTLTPICNSREILYYYRRMPNNRMLFGTRGDTYGDSKSAEKMKHYMTQCFRGVFPEWDSIDISHYWRGTIVYTRDFTPSVGNLDDDPSVYFSYGYSANGNNTTVYCGKKVAELICSSNSGEVNLPAVYKGLSPKFPFAFLRLWYLRFMLSYYRYFEQNKREL